VSDLHGVSVVSELHVELHVFHESRHQTRTEAQLDLQILDVVHEPLVGSARVVRQMNVNLVTPAYLALINRLMRALITSRPKVCSRPVLEL